MPPLNRDRDREGSQNPEAFQAPALHVYIPFNLYLQTNLSINIPIT